jgi:3-hydroxybutyryl-CoA dehydrogenase
MSSLSAELSNISVVGAGTMGRGIAATFIEKGYRVSVHDLEEERLENAQQAIESIFELFVEKGRLNEDAAQIALEETQYSTELEAIVKDADLVVEAVSEEMEVKQLVFDELDEYTKPTTILASNTSGLSITEIASATNRPEQVVGTHWFNPPYIVPLVEIVKGDQTDDELAEKLATFFEELDKTAVIVEKDIPGYIGNRIQMAMCYEAFSLLDRGIASAEDIDKAVKAGFGFRLPAMGIFEKVDQSGLDVHYAVESYLMGDLDRGTDPNPVVSRLVDKGDLGLKTGQGVYNWEDSDPDVIETERDQDLLRLLDIYENELK